MESARERLASQMWATAAFEAFPTALRAVPRVQHPALACHVRSDRRRRRLNVGCDSGARIAGAHQSNTRKQHGREASHAALGAHVSPV